MIPLYARTRETAVEIAGRHPEPSFYTDFAEELAESREFFLTNPLVLRARETVAQTVDNDLGHGLGHVTKVTLDAGALTLIEGRKAGYDGDVATRRLLLVQLAGLFHDIRRKEKDHARAGAEEARLLLGTYPLSPAEIGDICQAIANHEAFREPEPVNTVEGALISDSLYDADKFRWGPDNFTDTVWHMVSFFNAPMSVFLDRYPQGIESLHRIRDSFRTSTGKRYGPEFIDIGIAIGEELYGVLCEEYGKD
ncbi:MAG: hypothetical protein ACLFOY_11905 [Desulfatibacillaceae bacterium]